MTLFIFGLNADFKSVLFSEINTKSVLILTGYYF